MNRNDARKLLKLMPVIQAFADGQDIEYNRGSAYNPNWVRHLNPNFSGDLEDYRIKAPKIETWIIKKSNGDFGSTYDSEEAARKALSRGSDLKSYAGATIVKLVEEEK